MQAHGVHPCDVARYGWTKHASCVRSDPLFSSFRQGRDLCSPITWQNGIAESCRHHWACAYFAIHRNLEYRMHYQHACQRASDEKYPLHSCTPMHYCRIVCVRYYNMSRWGGWVRWLHFLGCLRMVRHGVILCLSPALSHNAQYFQALNPTAGTTIRIEQIWLGVDCDFIPLTRVRMYVPGGLQHQSLVFMSSGESTRSEV